MKALYKRFLWGSFFLLLLILSLLGINFFRSNFTGIGPSPTRSAFAGRLPSIQDGDQRRFQFFYATNRANNDDTFNQRGNQLGNTILTGTFEVLISPYMQVKPFIWFDPTSMEWGGHQELLQESFNTNLKQSVEASPHKSLLIVVWGFRDWFQSAALKTAYSAYVLDINTPVLLFDWPGNQGEGHRGYAASQQMATQSGPDLGKTLASIIQNTGAENIWIMGSSLGCQTICDSLVWLSDHPELIRGKPKLAHVILSAPDVSVQAFDEIFSEAIQGLSKHLTTYVSSNDRALLMSHWLNRGRRLGRKAEVLTPPENRKGQYEFEEALELLQLQANGARNISVVDATPINLLRNLHHFFTDSPVFFDDLYQRLLQPDDIVSRRLHSIRIDPRGVTYWILWND